MDNSAKPKRDHPRTGANIISQLFFLWYIPVLWKGCKTGLNTNDDLINCLQDDLSHELGDKLECEWKKQVSKSIKSNPSKNLFRRTLFKVFFPSIILDGALTFIYVMIRTFTPLVLGKLLNQYQPVIIIANVNQNYTSIINNVSIIINTEIHNASIATILNEITHDNNNINNSLKTSEIDYLWNDRLQLSLLLIMMLIGGAFIYHHTELRQRAVGARMRIACSSLIYRKILRLSRKACSEQANVGHIINLLSNDVSRFDYGFMFGHYAWTLPFQSILTCYLLYNDIGIAAIVGVIFLLIQTVPVQPRVSRIVSMLRGKIAQRSGKRIALMNEIIRGIQVIKMYAWEKSFTILIDKIRQREMKQIRYHFIVSGINSVTKIFVARLTLFVTILTIILLGHQLNTHIVFSMIQYFNYLQLFSTIFFMLALSLGAQALVSIDRIQEFLLCDEKEERALGYTKIKLNSLAYGFDLDNSLHSVEIINVSANWDSSDQLTLTNISINIKIGQFCAIVGPVGSGKTSLLNLLLGELSIITGNCVIKGDISYASQEPWLFSDTIKRNILFGEPYNEDRYNEVIECCALLNDLKQMQAGDETIIGDRGIMLSGGQRARINLARAIYKSANIYLLDDPLSAVDIHVGKILYQKIIGPDGFLVNRENNATRILVTHQMHFIQSADVIVAVDNGQIMHIGSYSDLLQYNINLIIGTNDNDNEETIPPPIGFRTDLDESPIIGFGEKSQLNDKNNEETTPFLSDVDRTIGGGDQNVKEIHFDEMQSNKHNSLNTWTRYFQATGSIPTLIMLLILVTFTQIIISGSDYFVNYWTRREYLRQHFINNFLTLTTYEYLSIYGVFMIIIILLAITRVLVFTNFLLRSSNNLHNQMFSAILKVPMHFFDHNPIGSIINRFSKDIGAVDEVVPRTMFEALQVVSLVIGVVILIIIVNPMMIVTLTIAIICYISILKFHLKSSQDLRRLEGVCKSPVFSYITTTYNGLSTIRASAIQSKIIQEFDSLQNVHSGIWHLNIVSYTYLGMCLDIISATFTACVILSFLNMTQENYSGNVGLAITQSLTLTGNVQYGFKQIAEIIQQMISTERVLEYTNLVQENNPVRMAPLQWPDSGKIEFKNVSIKYDKNKKKILKNIQLKIEPRWKVGIIGRTGAGKSSIINALFRLANVIDGEILIDGINTSGISLESLRSNISVIPQDPFLFSGTVRYNLDSLDVYDDHQLWQALENVGLKESISSLDNKIVEGGQNFSVGQRQLLCLARALLRQNKILILDEATANVDPQTDALIQRTIRTKFSQCTIIMIAHRLHTVIDANRIIVMDNGEMKEYDIPYLLMTDKTSRLSHMLLAMDNEESKCLKNIAHTKYINMKNIIH